MAYLHNAISQNLTFSPSSTIDFDKRMAAAAIGDPSHAYYEISETKLLK